MPAPSPNRIKCANPSCTKLTRTKYKFCTSCRKAGYQAPNPIKNPETLKLPEGVTEKGDEREVIVGTNEHVRTLEDLIRVCEIDTELWDIVEWHANKWEMGYKDAFDKGKTMPLFQVKARMKRKSPLIQTMQALRTALVEDIRNIPSILTFKGVRFESHYPSVEGDWLFEFSPFDLHMGKLTWDEETVTNYDVHHAEDLFNASLDFLLERAQRLTGNGISRVLCVFGNDVCHIDSKRGETTAGTHMDVDSRYIKVYRRIVAIHRRAVDILRQVAPVDIVVVPGNHDELTSFHLGEILEAVYENDARVTVDNNPHLRKYYSYGVNLFGFTHGDAEKVSELPLLMAREKPELWAQCSSREWHIGHKHIAEKFSTRAALEQDFFSDKGVRVRRLNSLSGHDAWHTKHGYTDRRTCAGFVFHKTAGFTDHIEFNVDHFTGEGLKI